MNIEEDPKLEELFLNRNLKSQTQELYIKLIKPYCIFLNKTPTELINEAITEERNGIWKTDRKIRKYFIQYQNHLLQQKQSPLTIKNTITIIRSFYNEYEIELPKLKLKLQKENPTQTTKDLLSKEEIRTVLKHANHKYKAIILLMMSSGMGISEIQSLTIEDFLKSIELDPNEPINILQIISIVDKKHLPIATWHIRRVKTDMPYFTFSSPESIYAILDYLLERENRNPLNKEYPLFAVKNRKTSVKGLVNYFMDLNDLCGFGVKGRQRYFRSHMLRKFFTSTLHKHNIQQINTDWMLGHSIDKVTDAYFKPDVDSLRTQYIDVLPYLSIEEVETRTVESDEFNELKGNLHEEREKREKLELFMEAMLDDPVVYERYQKRLLQK